MSMLRGSRKETRHADALVFGRGENEVLVCRTELDAVDLLRVTRSRLQGAKTRTCDEPTASCEGPRDGRWRPRSRSEGDCSRCCWRRS